MTGLSIKKKKKEVVSEDQECELKHAINMIVSQVVIKTDYWSTFIKTKYYFSHCFKIECCRLFEIICGIY